MGLRSLDYSDGNFFCPHCEHGAELMAELFFPPSNLSETEINEVTCPKCKKVFFVQVKLITVKEYRKFKEKPE